MNLHILYNLTADKGDIAKCTARATVAVMNYISDQLNLESKNMPMKTVSVYEYQLNRVIDALDGKVPTYYCAGNDDRELVSLVVAGDESVLALIDQTLKNES